MDTTAPTRTAHNSRSSPTRTGPGIALKYYLGILFVLTMIPALVTIGISAWQSGNTLKDGSRQVLLHGSRTLSMAVSAKMRGNIDLLRTIAIIGDNPVSRAELVERFNRGSGGKMGKIVIIDPASIEDNGLIHTSGIPRSLLQQAQALHQPIISNLFTEPASSAWRVAVIAPPLPGANDRSLLALVLTPANIADALGEHMNENAGLLVALTDGAGRLIVRSVEPEKFVGKRAPDWHRMNSLAKDYGTFEAISVDRGTIQFAYHHVSDIEGWTVVVGEPQSQFEGRWQAPLKSLLWAAAIATALALFGGFLGARAIVDPISALVRRAQSVVDNDDESHVVVPQSIVSEFEELRVSMDEAETALEERAEAERRAAAEVAERERRYRALATVGALTIWRRGREGRLMAADGWREFMGRPSTHSHGDWFDDVVPEDRAAVTAAWREAVAQGTTLDHEFRVMTPSGREHWVRARGAPVHNADGEITEWTGVLEDIQERRQAQARLKHLAYHDALTGLANRLRMDSAISEMLIACEDEQRCGAVLCLDLDRFKAVNDTMGHAAGDQLLQMVSDRLRANTKASDVIGRIGGDEFIILQQGPCATGDGTDVPLFTQEEAAIALAKRLIDRISTPYEIAGQRTEIGTSIGIALITPGIPAERLVRNGDRALYRAKAAGRGTYAFYDPKLDH